MRSRDRDIGWAGLVGVLLLTGAGCQQDGSPGGGGGTRQAATRSAPVTTPDIQATRGSLGKAYVDAARAHAGVLDNDYRQAESAINAVRRELSEAKQTARIDTQSEINRLDQTAIQVQRDIQNRSIRAHESANQLVDQSQALIAGLVSPQGPGGGGGPVATPMAEPAEPLGPPNAEPEAGGLPSPTP